MLAQLPTRDGRRSRIRIDGHIRKRPRRPQPHRHQKARAQPASPRTARLCLSTTCLPSWLPNSRKYTARRYRSPERHTSQEWVAPCAKYATPFRNQISVPFFVPPYTTVPKTGPKNGPVFRTAFLRSQRRKRRTPRSQDDATGYQKRCPRPRLWAPPLGAPSGNCISAAKPLNAAQSKPTRQRARC
jgi:hypothetical protein